MYAKGEIVLEMMKKRRPLWGKEKEEYGSTGQLWGAALGLRLLITQTLVNPTRLFPSLARAVYCTQSLLESHSPRVLPFLLLL